MEEKDYKGALEYLRFLSGLIRPSQLPFNVYRSGVILQ